jgi:hypothetical protein
MIQSIKLYYASIICDYIFKHQQFLMGMLQITKSIANNYYLIYNLWIFPFVIHCGINNMKH